MKLFFPVLFVLTSLPCQSQKIKKQSFKNKNLISSINLAGKYISNLEGSLTYFTSQALNFNKALAELRSNSSFKINCLGQMPTVTYGSDSKNADSLSIITASHRLKFIHLKSNIIF